MQHDLPTSQPMKAQYEAPEVSALGNLQQITEVTGANTSVDGEIFNS